MTSSQKLSQNVDTTLNYVYLVLVFRSLNQISDKTILSEKSEHYPLKSEFLTPCPFFWNVNCVYCFPSKNLSFDKSLKKLRICFQIRNTAPVYHDPVQWLIDTWFFSDSVRSANYMLLKMLVFLWERRQIIWHLKAIYYSIFFIKSPYHSIKQWTWPTPRKNFLKISQNWSQEAQFFWKILCFW